ncbi:MAG: GHKL domain-containing protein [Candidatus Phocaeicola faecigallinarum]|uniref:histidine kinase n=1 Tax=Candidatus Phocaeicola faecigallinarum TaxID=2838732 RepID=A0A948T9Z6_9BACT|nr:GHKL domain-containing protein [Candidatus Phocaeicola faecigallinarum]
MDELKKQIENLQTQLQQQEKLASLGMLTAGIMHEIRNPLNFVINFSKMSDVLLKDLTDILEDTKNVFSSEDSEEIYEIIADLKENLSKIKEHGDRAINIVNNILLSSRGKEDEWLSTDICKQVKEYVWLAYHAMRANYKDFNVTIEENYPENLPLISVIPQDLNRAVLNVINNAYYAVWEKEQNCTDRNYRPLVSVSINLNGGELCISIADNGKGISEENKQKIYDNFFTTKPVGHGTGLGMSIVRNIIIQKHKGRIEFESVLNEGTKFSLIIPVK